LRAVDAFARARRYPFALAADERRATARAYGVYVRLNFESWNMARPSTFLIDPAGVLRAVYVGAHQRDWLASAALWSVVDGHARGPTAP